MADVDKFLALYGPAALATERKYGVPALVTLSQHVWEGGWENKNAGHNLFGVKVTPNWKGGRQLQLTWEVHTTPDVKYPKVVSVTKRPDGKWHYRVYAWFRAYPSVQAAYEDHALFLRQNKRYAPAFAVKHDPVAFAREMAKAGYATDPDYFNKLQKTIAIFKKKGFPAGPLAAPAPSSLPASPTGTTAKATPAAAPPAPTK
ncbi:peptidoglycan hydrolase [Hymenobacter sp. BT18]|uniref:glycoside hydrolase family 73 protein n=1 Tax=Hymenobacter sp. BT18 TaxID=2835648 RepID=UPI00143E3100|nr:glucosaminidase domain-containing protein [Hymenobacter sp. BT18]QIX59712.1 peptidoglycan hydrolase [Hymenobacter sp. BT18]